MRRFAVVLGATARQHAHREDRTIMRVPPHQAKAEFLRTIGHPVRIHVLKLLQDGPLPVRSLLNQIEIEPASLSQHLAVLRRAGLVAATREGGTVVYALSTSGLRELMLAARKILTERLAGQTELLSELRAEAGR
jgi:ArsR family transcriptional regulator